MAFLLEKTIWLILDFVNRLIGFRVTSIVTKNHAHIYYKYSSLLMQIILTMCKTSADEK